MNPSALLILLIPALGLISIIQRRSWRIVEHWAMNTLFWIGWFGSLVVGIIALTA